MSVKEITKDNFEDTIQNNPIVVLDFWAEWCGPCKAFSPIFHDVAGANMDVVFGSINVDQQPELSNLFEIRAVPFLMILKKGTIVFAESGTLPKSALQDLVNQAKELDELK